MSAATQSKNSKPSKMTAEAWTSLLGTFEQKLVPLVTAYKAAVSRETTAAAQRVAASVKIARHLAIVKAAWTAQDPAEDSKKSREAFYTWALEQTGWSDSTIDAAIQAVPVAAILTPERLATVTQLDVLTKLAKVVTNDKTKYNAPAEVERILAGTEHLSGTKQSKAVRDAANVAVGNEPGQRTQDKTPKAKDIAATRASESRRVNGFLASFEAGKTDAAGAILYGISLGHRYGKMTGIAEAVRIIADERAGKVESVKSSGRKVKATA